ncbi:hypothetical protein jhhlp_008683 [Lomentospora prolificans]|uniref:ZW10 C-terminal helical domain-containing protein n=1 Tax=Lomentospora prolificans TaxID=41688 RepID=A0A2N3MYR2_9PEZI|nr:hypothetical protein jhhlp_008683 [Lomentospora prolificans]
MDMYQLYRALTSVHYRTYTRTRAMASTDSSGIGSAIVAFTLDGRFPESESLSSLPIASESLPPALEALAKTRSDLEKEIHEINEDTKEDVSSWVRNAKSLQEDIVRSKVIANDIIRQSEEPDVSGKAIEDAEARVDFLAREVQYTQQLQNALQSIKHVNQLLSQAEEASNERRILDSLHLLEQSWTAMDSLPVSKTCRAVKLLNVRSFELKSSVHEVLNQIWKDLVNVDIDSNAIRIQEHGDGNQLSLADAVIGLRAYKEVQERMEQLWHNLDGAILTPRMDLTRTSLPSIRADTNTLMLAGETNSSAEALLTDLSTVFTFLSERLPPDLLETLCSVMMGDVTDRIIKVWLDSAIPPALRDLDKFQSVIKSAEQLCSVLETHGYSGFEELRNWVDNAPTVWLNKCRETALDSVRSKLSGGIGNTKSVEKIERQMVSLAEGKELAKSGTVQSSATEQEWDSAWGFDDDMADEPEDADESMENKYPNAETTAEDDGVDAWGWDDGPDDIPEEPDAEPEKPSPKSDEDVAADAWGWGDEDTVEEPPRLPEPKKQKRVASVPRRKETKSRDEDQTREMVLKETYHISSMPEPVLGLISAILEDGAALTGPGNETNPVASAASGLFGIPPLALALFRAISPYYYSLDVGGSMYLYNDAVYLAEKLAEFSQEWKAREDLTPRARNMLRIDNEVKNLQNFANRAYSAEMSTQKTVVRDLLGGAHSLLHQEEMESCIDSAVARVRSMAVTWEEILARSVWCQAVGSLVDAVAAKIITDVMELSSIGQDEAYNIANMIAKVAELDDIFLPSKLSGRPEESGEVALTAQYAPSWLRLQYLSEVLQSNLNEIRYLWFESELSLYFSPDEVVDLVNVSFEANARSKEVIREIRDKPHPRTE